MQGSQFRSFPSNVPKTSAQVLHAPGSPNCLLVTGACTANAVPPRGITSSFAIGPTEPW